MKILIIGKNSRITQFLKEYLDKNFSISIKGYSELIKKNSLYFSSFKYIINCSSNKKYISSRYNSAYDFDYKIAKKIIRLDSSYIFLSTRKVYEPKKIVRKRIRLNRCVIIQKIN